VSSALLDLAFDHIFFTGSPAIGKVVMTAAAKHLAAVTLELGGKSPVIVDESADIAKAAKSIAWGKFTNCGQTCIAPDYAFVHESRMPQLIEAMKESIAKMYSDPARSPDYQWEAFCAHLTPHRGRSRSWRDHSRGWRTRRGAKIHRADAANRRGRGCRDHARRNFWPGSAGSFVSGFGRTDRCDQRAAKASRALCLFQEFRTG
jgi:hypothetical protein